MVQPKYHVFVCTSCRLNGSQKGFCYNKKAVSVVQKFVEEIEARDLSNEVLVTVAECFGICDKGPVVVIYPEGAWYGNVSVEDVPEIVESHLEGGIKVERLLM